MAQRIRVPVLLLSATALMLSQSGLGFGLPMAVQDRSVPDAVVGKDFKNTFPVSELSDNFKAASIQTSAGMSLIELYGTSGYYSMGVGGEDSKLLLALTQLLWTKGELVTVGGKEFLVAYRFEFGNSLAAFSAFEGPAGNPSALPSKPPEFRLKLISTSQIVSIEPRPDITASEVRTKFSPSDNSNRAKGIANAKQLGLAMSIYAADADDYLPFGESTAKVQELTLPYLKSRNLWQTNNPAGSQFYVNMAITGVNVSSIPNPAGTVMIYESAPWADKKRIVVFVDGHASEVDAPTWERLKGTLTLKFKKGPQKVAKKAPARRTK